ncbi:hypothetical protein [Janthinobacterium sp. HLX7-2]|uniref:hypothetical protein n=1 Tax=Janthinobacterium sp. HLX7-2 TaxID=1259331 RepID=UPI003F28FFC7
MTEQDEQAAKDDVQRATARLAEVQVARMKGCASHVWPGADQANADMRDYCGETHPVAGCTLVLRFGTDRWDAVSYAPGYAPFGREGVISDFFSRPLGSAGIAVDSFIRNGGTWKPDFARMVQAERDYSVGISL